MRPEGTNTVVIGAGGFGREVLDVIEAAALTGSGHRFVGFVDDGQPAVDLIKDRGAVLLEGFEDPRAAGAAYLVGIGDPAVRAKVDADAGGRGLRSASVVHPTATFGALVSAGPGLVVCSSVCVTTNVTFGRHVHLNLGATVGHDCEVGDHVSVFPNVSVSGEVTIGAGVTIGTGTVIIQGVTVGAGTTIGAGSVVTRDLPPGVIAMGSPAKPVREVD